MLQKLLLFWRKTEILVLHRLLSLQRCVEFALKKRPFGLSAKYVFLSTIDSTVRLSLVNTECMFTFAGQLSHPEKISLTNEWDAHTNVRVEICKTFMDFVPNLLYPVRINVLFTPCQQIAAGASDPTFIPFDCVVPYWGPTNWNSERKKLKWMKMEILLGKNPDIQNIK